MEIILNIIIFEEELKIIFNSFIHDWFWQIYDELKRHHNVILPENC